MQFMLIVKTSGDSGCGCESSEELSAEVGKYTQELRRAGALVELSRLHPGSKGARVKLQGKDRIVVDGPFAETKELIGGYWIIQANSLDEAVAWAKRAPAPEGKQECEIEIRQFLDVENLFPAGLVGRAVETVKELPRANKQSQ
ncbi:MAG TPA: YciI family protein [Candidatus Saccharimonadales bacterium]|jgi:hypothetical protein|nr:YciI family protein [Candidatus Saccharimonadales bacterium]